MLITSSLEYWILEYWMANSKKRKYVSLVSVMNFVVLVLKFNFTKFSMYHSFYVGDMY